MSDYPKHDKAVDSALHDLGVHEQPMGSNRGPRVQVYQHATWLGGSGFPWCVAAWLYWTLHAGLNMPYHGAGAYALLDWARKVGWDVPLNRAMPGDAVIFNVGSGHCAMFLSLHGSTVKTVDGNVSDSVALRERPVSLVRGCVHVPEAPQTRAAPARTQTTPAAKAPTFEVVSSESGHKRVIFNGKASTIGQKLPRFLRKNPSITVRRRKRRA